MTFHARVFTAVCTFAAVFTLVVSPLPARAQDAYPGVAVVQAPEQSSGIAFGADRQKTVADAIGQCVEGGAMAQDCIVTNWCSPAGWTVDFFVQHREGLHWHETICGIADHAVIAGLETAMCDRTARPYLIECALVQVWDPQGKPTMEW